MTMKKIFALTCILILASAGLALADVTKTASSAIVDGSRGGQVGAGTIGTAGNEISHLSTGVGLGWTCDVNGYALITEHTNGTKTYGTAADSTAIYTNDAKPLTAPSASDDSAVSGAGWTSL